jgi:hypothetical protein
MIATPELNVQRNLTKLFIAADPQSIQIMRSTRTPNGSGGYVVGPPTAVGTPQTLRLIPLGDGATERYDANGKQVFPQYMLLGEYTADVQRWDTFTLDGARYQVVFVNQNKQYEIKAEVIYLG